MSIHVALNHVTHYKYDRPIHLGPQVVRLRPAPHSRTRILSYSMRVEPTTHFVNWQQDPQSNYLARLVFPKVTTFFRVEVDLVAEMAVLNPFDFFLEPSAEKFPFRYEPELLVELEPYLLKGPATPKFVEYLSSIDISERPTSGFLMDLNQRLQKDIAYLIRMEPGVQTPEQTLVNRSGSCRDSGWLMVQLLRHLGLAARFVSGYLIQLKSDVKSLDGPSGTEVDFTDLHAWCEVYLPGAGWIGLDPTSGLYAGEGHIPLACSPEPSSAAPISGEIDPCETTFEHRMSVRRIWEAPRVTLPYSDAQWAAIDALGNRVDADLVRQDVRLTQGGEPTFVSIDDREGGEWNTEAMGPTKRILSVELMERLRQKYGQGGLLHFGQGKWYPGEQLPRWSLNLYWRKDGEPLWNDPSLWADEHADDGATVATRRRVPRAAGDAPRRRSRATSSRRTRTRGTSSGASASCRATSIPSIPAWPTRMERARLRRVFERGLDAPVGYALPVGVDERRPGRWLSSPWYLRDDRCYLIPGDSPIGYRLPLDSLPWAAPEDIPWLHAPDPTQPLPPLPPRAPVRHDDAGWHATAEPRDGVISEHPTPGGTHDVEAATHRRGRARDRDAADAVAGFRRSSAGGDGAAARAAALRIGRLRRPHRHQRRAAGRASLRLHAADGDARGLSRSRRRGRGHGGGDADAGHPRRLRAAARPAPAGAAGDARSGRDRGQRPSGVELGRAGRHDHPSLRRRARDAADEREVHARRPPHRHRRRQPLRARRRHPRRLAVPAPARPARQHDLVLAQPSGAELRLLRHVRRPDQPGAAHRRGAQRLGLRDRGRLRRAAPRRRGHRRQVAAVAGRPAAAQPADRRHRQHPSRRVLHRQAVLARRLRPAGSACSRCAPSRCRRMRA